MFSNSSNRVAVVASAQTQLRTAWPDRQHVDLISEAVVAVLKGSGIRLEDVDHLGTTPSRQPRQETRHARAVIILNPAISVVVADVRKWFPLLVSMSNRERSLNQAAYAFRSELKSSLTAQVAGQNIFKQAAAESTNPDGPLVAVNSRHFHSRSQPQRLGNVRRA